MSLPSEFTALYRLFLRATSAAVLNNGPATRGLRRLYRPTFEAGASAVRRLESLSLDKHLERSADEAEAENVRRWLKTFDERINNTLSFLRTSSYSRGLSHQVITRLFQLSRSNYPWMTRSQINEGRKGGRPWNPKLDPKSPEYSIEKLSIKQNSIKNLKNSAQKAKDAGVIQKCWGALGEVIQMAEARDGLMFGRVRFKRQEFRKRKFY